MLNVLIPCAGHGRRFVEAGYLLPKALIEVDGLPMIERVIQNLQLDENQKLWVVVRKDSAVHEFCKSRYPDSFIVLEYETEGAAQTCLRARHRINDSSPLLIANCDQLIILGSRKRTIVEMMMREKEDASILTFKADGSNRWSYVDVHYGIVQHVAEKNPISNRATCGYYWFRRGRDFVIAAEKMIAANDRTNKEFYVAPAINYMIAEGFKVKEVRCETHGAKFVGMGTPEDLELYLRKGK